MTTAESARAVLMIRPTRFASNPETAASNRFQHADREFEGERDAARREFDALAENLDRYGVRVHVFEGARSLTLPDEVFPNNWITTHADGTIVLYPMQAPNRRRERRGDVVDWLEHTSNYTVHRVLDLSALENDSDYLEGTGSIVFDDRMRSAYCALSARTTAHAVTVLTDALRLEPRMFDSRDRDGFPIYHTNVLLSIGPELAIVCLDAIVPRDRQAIGDALVESGRELMPITLEQMGEFAANVLALESSQGAVIAASTRAWRAFDRAQQRRLERHGTIVQTDIPTIETLGGGSVRCMLAEIRLPARTAR